MRNHHFCIFIFRCCPFRGFSWRGNSQMSKKHFCGWKSSNVIIAVLGWTWKQNGRFYCSIDYQDDSCEWMGSYKKKRNLQAKGLFLMIFLFPLSSSSLSTLSFVYVRCNFLFQRGRISYQSPKISLIFCALFIIPFSAKHSSNALRIILRFTDNLFAILQRNHKS